MNKILLLAVLLISGSVVMAQNYEVNAQKSTVKWIGKKISKQHTGTIGLKSGNLKIEDNKIVTGVFVIDMNKMTDDDHKDPSSPGRLVGHLKSDLFFNVEKYPEAKLEILSSDTFEKGAAQVKGNLTIKGITKPITFKVVQKGTMFTTSLVFDRSLYNVKYGSGKFFENLGDKAILDEIGIEVSLLAERQR